MELDSEVDEKIDDIINRIDASGTPDETAAKIVDMIKEKQNDEL